MLSRMSLRRDEVGENFVRLDVNQAFETVVNIGAEKLVYMLDTQAVREINPCMKYRSRLFIARDFPTSAEKPLYIMIQLQNTAYTPMTRPIQCFSPQTIVQKSR